MAPSAPLLSQLPPPGVRLSPDELLSRFLTNVEERGISLYPAQEEAILELFEGKHVILGTPTGSGKSLVAEALHFKGLCEGKVSFYTCPIKALVNEKFFALCESFGPENVGMMTGDATVNRNAPIVCCTAEILANLALTEEGAEVDYVVMDEFHYYADRERGVAWQLPLLAMPGTQFLLMSATLGPIEPIAEPLEQLTKRAVAHVKGLERPVPLAFEYCETPLHETIAKLIETDWAPIYLVNFTQRSAAENAQALTSINLCSKEEKEAIRQTLFDTKFGTPYGKDVEKYLRAGIGLHHAGILPKYRRLTERLAQAGLLKVICGTDTLGMGINIPIRTVLFTQLCKFDGQKVGIVRVRDFLQIAGRAGRKGFDEKGKVVAQAPEYVIENLKLAAKAAGKKFQRKPPPQKNFVNWDKNTFERLRTQPPEKLESRFSVSFGTLVTLLKDDQVWPRGGYGRLMELVGRSHLNDYSKQKQKLLAAKQFRALRRAGIIEVVPFQNRLGSYIELGEDLQDDFSLYQTLSLFLVAAIETLDPQSETYGLDLLSLVEATLENPTVVLLRQVDRLKDEKMAELKASGVPYEERIAELEKVEAPRPLSELVFGIFAAFAERHPWLAGEDLYPKSVARDLYERLSSFNDYVVEYGLQRSEGVLLRYLSEVYRALAHNVPATARNEQVEDIIDHLRTLLREIDSSLVDEWEAMIAEREGRAVVKKASAEPKPVAPLVVRYEDDPKRLAAHFRSEAHRLLKALAGRRYGEALGLMRPLEGEQAWDEAALEAAMAPYFEVHAAIDLRPVARLPHNTLIQAEGEHCWSVIQKIVDPEGESDWMLECRVDWREGETEAGAPFLTLRRIGT